MASQPGGGPAVVEVHVVTTDIFLLLFVVVCHCFTKQRPQGKEDATLSFFFRLLTYFGTESVYPAVRRGGRFCECEYSTACWHVRANKKTRVPNCDRDSISSPFISHCAFVGGFLEFFPKKFEIHHVQNVLLGCFHERVSYEWTQN